jgi:DNA-binding YbaB/EbfC family protein
MFKGLGDFAALFKEAQQIKGRAEEMQERLGRLRVEGRAGGEMVVVTASGLQRVLSVKIDPSLLQTSDAEMVEDLVLAATNQALDKARDAAAAEMAQLTGNLQIPPALMEMVSKFGSGGNGTGV